MEHSTKMPPRSLASIPSAVTPAEHGLLCSGWRPMSDAPLDGTPIQARIPAHGEDNVIAYHFIGDCGEPDGGPAHGWTFVTDQEPPADWTDGWCWAVNEDGKPSTKPTHWRHLPSGPRHPKAMSSGTQPHD